MNSEMPYVVWLSLVGGAASDFAWDACEKFGSAETACRELFISDGPKDPMLTEKYRMKLAKYPFSDAQKICETAERSGIRLITRGSAEYPQMLNDIDVPPFLLYCRGDISQLLSGKPLMAMVGARYPTNYSLKVASSLSRDLVRCGFGIVSGFAVGTDITCHLSACAAGGVTFAVVGCGLNCAYPRQNHKYAKIIEENGAFISEYPPDQPPRAYCFPVRNRILAGIACGTCVIEAGIKSGSLVTADHANDQGKTVFVVPPGDIFNRAYSGNVMLLRNGAQPLMSARDPVNEYFLRYEHKLTPTAKVLYDDAAAELSLSQCEAKASGKTAEDISAPKKRSSRKDPDPAEKNKTVKISADIISAEIEDTSVPPPVPSWEGRLDEEQQACADVLRKFARPATADEIAAELGSDVSELLILLTEMELDGIVSGGAGKTYSLVCG